jgi:hypothetical protein
VAIDTRALVPHAAVAGVFSAITIGLVLGALQRPYGRPQNTFDRCVARYAAGTLTKDEGAERCGQDVLWPAIRAAGRSLYDETVVLYDRADEIGKTRLREATAAAFKAGRAAFIALPYDERSRINATGKQTFIYSHGLGALSPEERPLVPDASVLLDATKRAALVRTLGETAESGATSAAARARAGNKALDLITSKVERAGNAAFNALSHDDRQAVEDRGYSEYVCKEGFARLSDADKAAVGTPGILMDRAAQGERAAALGRTLLDPADRAKLSNKTRKEFVAARDTFVETEGRRMIGSRLVASFKQSRPTLQIERYSGTLLAWYAAAAAVRWSDAESSDAAHLLGSGALFERHGHAWTMEWR